MEGLGTVFQDRSSGLFAITSVKWKQLKPHYVVEMVERPKEGEPSIADIKMAISSTEFLMSKKKFNKCIELDIIKIVNDGSKRDRR